jgi:3-deoxy-D-manno-octulosonic-acid transferase
MKFIYTIFLYLYYYGIKLYSYTNKKARLWIDGRENIVEKLDTVSIKNCIWFHASSLGEFEQVSYLIEKIKQEFPHKKILVTFFSPSGYELKKNFRYADKVMYLPFDFKNSVSTLIRKIQPQVVFWVRYEFWLNTLEALKENNIPTILLNGVFRKNNSVFYIHLLKRCLHCFTEINVINSTSQENLKQLGFASTVLYDTRFSRMNQVVQSPFEDETIQHFVNCDKVVICGSIWENDDRILNASIKANEDINWILVPHEVDQPRIQELSSLFPNAQLYSQYDKSKKTNILIIDCVGLLSRIYRFADLAYVGGGFNKVVHSLVEPLAYSLPVIIGPNIDKSEEAKELLGLGFVNRIYTQREFDIELKSMLSNDHSTSRNAKQVYFQERINSLDNLLKNYRALLSSDQ